MAKEPQNDIDLFVQSSPKTITTVDGKTIPVPPVTWRRELSVMDLIRDAVTLLVKTGVFTAADAEHVQSPQVVSEMLGLLLKEAPDRVTKAVAAILSKEEDWVCDNLESTQILGLLLPFLRNRIDAIRGEFQRHIEVLKQLQVAATQTVQ